MAEPATVRYWAISVLSSRMMWVNTGIYQDDCGLRAVVSANGRKFTKRFPPNYPVKLIKRWRTTTALSAPPQSKIKPLDCPTSFPPSGQTYIYFICENDETVKIGHARDIALRLRDLQTGNGRPLRLIGYICAHCSRETEIHRQFWHLHTHGEWFRLSKELLHFIFEIARPQ